MKVLIAGGAGYIGSALVPRLLDRGYEVGVLDLFWFGNNLPDEVTIVEKDIFDLTEDDIAGYEQIVFLAGLSNDPMAEYSPAENFISNAAAPAYLGYMAKRAGVRRFVYAGSCSVYGYTVNELYDEESPAVSNYPYGISKLQGEQAVLQMQDENFSVIALRQGTVCGYSPRMRLDLAINTMFKCAMTEGRITINNPAIWRPILGIRDAVTGYVRAIEANQAISGIFNIASGNYTVGEIGDLVRAGLKKHLELDVDLEIKHLEDFRNYKVETARARTVLSFHPSQDVVAIVEELVERRRDFEDYDNPLYYNIETYKRLRPKGASKA